MQVTIDYCTAETYVDEILVNVTGSLCTSIIPASELQCSRRIGDASDLELHGPAN